MPDGGVARAPARPGTAAGTSFAFLRVGNLSRLRRLLAVLVPILIWQIGAAWAQNRLLPSPALVLQRLWEDVQAGIIWDNAQVTLGRGLIGLGIALVVGIGLGLAMARNRWIDAMFEPLLTALYPVPKLALYPILILVFGFGAASKIALVALECAYPILYNTYAGAQNVNRRWMWVARNVGASRWAQAGITLRAASPSVLAGLRMALPIMLVIIVITELIGESRGLGFLIRQAGTQFEPEGALAIIVLLAIIGFVLDRLLVAVGRRITFWQKGVTL